MTRFSIPVFLMVIILLIGCKKGDDHPRVEPARTLLVYMAANNSLNSDAYANLNQMESAYNSAIHGKLVVYARLQDVAPAIYEIQHDQSPDIVSRIVKTYPEHNSSDPEVMHQVLRDMQELGEADAYGLILWSHATSWHPDPSISLFSFGDDGGETMDIQELRDALPNDLDFLLFDACSMASVEVLYELKDKAKYILASPAEVIAAGIPYDKILSHLYEHNLVQGLTDAAKAYFRHYDNLSGSYRSATISLVDSRQITSLAIATKDFLSHYYTDWEVLVREEVQRLDFAEESPTAGFDLLDFYNKNFPEADLSSLEKALEACVLYEAHTPDFNGKPVHAHCGVSMYIPHNSNEWVHDYYQNLGWYGVSGAGYIFDKL